jgi:hypothetical protein
MNKDHRSRVSTDCHDQDDRLELVAGDRIGTPGCQMMLKTPLSHAEYRYRRSFPESYAEPLRGRTSGIGSAAKPIFPCSGSQLSRASTARMSCGT